MNETNRTESRELVQKSVQRLMADLPAPVQKFLASPERDAVSLRLSKKHNLHVDQAGAFEESYLFMLLGVFTPQEFVESLKEAGLTPEQVSGLAEDVNREVFMRIRDEERLEQAPAQAVTPVQKPSAPTPPSVPIPPVPVRTQVPIYSPMPTPAAPPTTPVYVPKPVERPTIQKQVAPPAMLPGQMPVATPKPIPIAPERIQLATPPAPIPPKPVPPPPVRIERPAPTPPPAPETDAHARIMHTMARDMQAVKSGTDPMRVAHPAPPAWATAPTPKPAPTPEPIVTAPVVATQPKAVPVQPTPPVERVAPIPTPPAQPQEATLAPQAPKPAAPHVSHSPQALTQHLKQYGVDPYREPVE